MVIKGRVEIAEEDISIRPPIPGPTQIILDPADPTKGTVVEVLGKGSKSSIMLDGSNHAIKLYDGMSFDAAVVRINIDDTEGARLVLGGGNTIKRPGFLTLLRNEGTRSVTLDGGRGSISLYDRAEKEVLRMDDGGNIVLRDQKGKLAFTLASQTGGGAGMWIGGDASPSDGPKSGYVAIRNSAGKDSITLDGNSGDIMLYDEDGKHSFSLHGKVDDYTGLWLGASLSADGANKPGKIFLRDGSGNESITLDGKAGDIFLGNGDCAEDFDIAESAVIEPGTVMVLDQEGKLHQSMEAYDKKVAGVISGAGDCKPGIVLDKKHSQVNRKAVALMGKVYCKVDTQSSSIEVGDLLTTSSTPGHAMKAAEPLKAFGAVIGKALRSLKEGQGLIPILVTLQ